MDLSEQVVSLEIAKRLKELGVSQRSIFFWSVNDKGENSYIISKKDVDTLTPLGVDLTLVSAFTVAELLEFIGNEYAVMLGPVGPSPLKYIAMWGNDDDYPVGDFNANTAADALSKVLIHLLENQLLTLK